MINSINVALPILLLFFFALMQKEPKKSRQKYASTHKNLRTLAFLSSQRSRSPQTSVFTTIPKS